MAFSFEDLKVYRESLNFVQDVQECLTELGKHCPNHVRDQLSRAALSIPLNIAEGNGRWHKAEKKQFFWIARGSVYECVAITQVMARMGLLSDHDRGEFYEQLTELAKMLSGLIRSVEDLKERIKL